MTDPAAPFRVWTKRSVLAIVAACLLLLSLIGFLVYLNYQGQIALRESALNRFRLELEKRSASLEYFFSERKYDLSSFVLSREINTYFTNKSMGMSEQYGLKVNLFMIQQLFQKAIEERNIKNAKIYTRFALFDPQGRTLADTAPTIDGQAPALRELLQNADKGSSQTYIDVENEKLLILMSAPCHSKGKTAGTLACWIDCTTILDHFVNFGEDTVLNGASLVDEKGRLFSPYERSADHFSRLLTQEKVRNLPISGFSFFPFTVNGNRQEILVARLPVHDLDVNFIAWMPSRQIVNSLTPWNLFAGMGLLAAAVLISLGLIIWFTAQNMILKARYFESEKQHDLLTAKNLQLKNEIGRRLEAERELEAQRTLRMRSDRLRSLGEMAAGIAHELNQPLVGVRGYAELLIDSLENGIELTRDQIAGNISMIIRQADRMVHIINHVRLFARDAGSIETSRVDLNDVVRSSLSLIKAQFTSHGLHLEQELTPQELPVQVNPFSVEEVILNLLSNARHSVELRKETEGETYTPCIRITTKSLNTDGREEVSLTITDNGAGIPADVADRIFDPFFTTKSPDKGSGLGLSISKSLIESFKGHIQFFAADNEETSFKITFPLCSRTGAGT